MPALGLPKVPDGLTIAEKKQYLRETYPHRIVVPFEKIDECGQWCGEHCSGEWHNFNGASGFHFNSAADAMLFKLTWC